MLRVSRMRNGRAVAHRTIAFSKNRQDLGRPTDGPRMDVASAGHGLSRSCAKDGADRSRALVRHSQRTAAMPTAMDLVSRHHGRKEQDTDDDFYSGHNDLRTRPHD